MNRIHALTLTQVFRLKSSSAIGPGGVADLARRDPVGLVVQTQKSGADVGGVACPNYIGPALYLVEAALDQDFNLPRMSQMSRSVINDTTSLATGV